MDWRLYAVSYVLACGWNGIGTIEFQIVGNQVGFKDENPKALPLIPYVRNFPLVDELVILFSLPDSNIGESSKNTSYYYLNPIVQADKFICTVFIR